MFFRESVGYSWSPACHATLRKVDCHLYGRAVLGQASFMLGRRGRSLSRCPASRDGVRGCRRRCAAETTAPWGRGTRWLQVPAGS